MIFKIKKSFIIYLFISILAFQNNLYSNSSLNNINDYEHEIASSRTFSFLHEIEMLLENGLIQGGDLNNAIVYVDKPLSKKTMERLKKAFNKKSNR